eukprot:TRINITY_DN3591_c0_g2_i1.p4 TRINITY_DN3591_c0_g2~~TRINITY_DN3591_c0_g2_i1.p4  ORF type:complete len:152 (-),score=10.49 TRINITY_DN3591_c0_g2_i1:1715-2170(-)
MANWGCNTALDVFMYIVVTFFAVGSVAFLGLFATCAADNELCSRTETLVGFVLFIVLGIASCLGCVYFCACSLSKDELEKRRETEQFKKQPLVIPYRRYQKQNSQFLKNVIYEGPSGEKIEVPAVDEGDIIEEDRSGKQLLADQNTQENMV